MPTIEENRSIFGGTYDWSQAGEEWSKDWGSTPMQWHGSIVPRIRAFIPTDTILEIAPGYGRWTGFLKDLCKRLIVVDLSRKCIESCQQRFANCSNISYFVNDGMSLEMVADGSVDFIFTFDSLVHAEEPVLKAYTAQFVRKLRPNGAAFVHHSNLGEYTRKAGVQSRMQEVPKLLGLLQRLGICDDLTKQSRARSMTARKMAMFAEEHDLQCISQELVNWQSSALIDCLSTLVPRGSRWGRPNRVIRNAGFMFEAQGLAKLSCLYDLAPATE